MGVEVVDMCTCGHLRSQHRQPPLGTACVVDGCVCKRFDRRNFSDAELELLRLGELDRMRFAQIQQKADRADKTGNAAAASKNTLQRIAVALERIAAELEVIARPARHKNPCPRGGYHFFSQQPGDMKCGKCGANWSETDPP